MAMTLLNDSSVALSLGQLNKNITKVGKSLAKLSTGQRITGASVDTATFAISEKMREQLRSLEQDIQNVQNGSAMLKTAHGGIENIVEELRSLKELAINAANDSNTDADRQIIQKEFDKRRDTIDDIATWTNYNTKPLLDGTYVRASSSTSTIDYQANVYMDTVTGMFDLPTTIMRGKEAPNVSWVNGLKAYGRIPVYEEDSTDETDETTDDSDDDESIEKWTTFNFSGLKTISGSSVSIPSGIDQQGFSILCSDYPGCPSFHSFVFDASMNVGTAQKRLNSTGPAYLIGVKGIKSVNEIAGAIYNGLQNMIEKNPSYPEKVQDGVILLQGHGDQVDIRQDSEGEEEIGTSGTYSFRQHYPMWIYEGYDRNALNGGGYNVTATKYNDYNPLTIHSGTHANQATNFYINDMHTKSLKSSIPNEKDKEDLENLSNDSEKYSALMNTLAAANAISLDETSVRTKDDANVTIRVVDSAIEYALNEATYVGAYLQRLEYTESNVVTTEENIQGAESTIRDADMAKEMTEYTKNNVLSQAAQSMLPQANQNLSSVLSLLQ